MRISWIYFSESTQYTSTKTKKKSDIFFFNTQKLVWDGGEWHFPTVKASDLLVGMGKKVFLLKHGLSLHRYKLSENDLKIFSL